MSAARTWLTATAMISLVALSGCVDERSFYIRANRAVCVPTDTGGAATSTEEVQLGAGTLDISDDGLKQGYRLFPVIVNDMVESSQNDNEPERNNLRLKRFDVELNVGQLGKLNQIPSELRSFSVLATGFIPPTSELKIDGVKVIPDAFLNFVNTLPPGGRDLIIAKIQAVADHNGSELKSVEFEFPIEICRGCLVVSIGDCVQPSGPVPTNGCGLAQDSPITCCTTSGFRTCLTGDALSALPAPQTPTP